MSRLSLKNKNIWPLTMTHLSCIVSLKTFFLFIIHKYLDVHTGVTRKLFFSYHFQVSQHPQATVWTLCRMTILPTGSIHCRHSQRWMSLLAPQCPLSPHTVALLEPSSPTEPAGPLIQPQPQPTPPPSSTHLPQASRLPSEPQPRPPQICYRVPAWTAIRNCEIPFPLSEKQPTNTADESVQSY